MTLSVRPVERVDADELAAVHVEALRAGYRGIVTDAYLDGITLERGRAAWAGWLGAEQLPRVTVAVRDGAIVGFCSVDAPSRDEDAGDGVAEISVLNVSPTAWRSGVGSALVEHALADFRRDGWRTVTLWVADKNQRARCFYERLGFELDGAEGAHQGSGERKVRMRLELIDGRSG